MKPTNKLFLNKKIIANLSLNQMAELKGGLVPVQITSLFLCVNSRRNCIDTIDCTYADCPILITISM